MSMGEVFILAGLLTNNYITNTYYFKHFREAGQKNTQITNC